MYWKYIIYGLAILGALALLSAYQNQGVTRPAGMKPTFAFFNKRRTAALRSRIGGAAGASIMPV
jgi:hypothetical protein